MRSGFLVGRGEQLTLLERALSAARTAGFSAVLLTGEAGVGKSRLVEEFLASARRQGARTVTGTCVALSTCTLPFGPFADILRQARLWADDARADVVREVSEELDGPSGRTAPPDEPGDALARTRIFGLMQRLFAALSDPAPLVVVVEDVHWADASSLDLLRFLLATLRNEPVVLLLTYRSDELPAGHPSLVQLQEMSRAARSSVLALEPLARPEVAELVAAIRGRPAPPGLAERVLAESDGNPFYVEELLAAGFPDVPILDTRLRHLLLARSADLSERAREVLRIAAVCGRIVEHAVLEAVWEGAGLAGAVRECVDRHLLEIAPQADGYAFRHVLLRDAAYQDLLAGERRRLHARVATALGDDRIARSSRVIADRAHHWYAAAAEPEALAAGVCAARAFRDAYGFAESYEQYERVLQLWDRVRSGDRPPGLTRPDLLAEAADVARLACEAPAAVRLLRQALAGTRDDEQPERAALLLERLGRCLWEAGETEQAAAICARGGALLAEAPPTALRARLLAAQGWMLMLLGRFPESAALSSAAVDMARAVGADGVELQASITHGVGLVMTGDTTAGLATLRETCRRAVAGPQLEELVRAFGNLAAALGRLCDFEGSLAAADEGLAELASRGLPASVGGLLVTNACESLVALGRWDEAEARIRDALSGRLPTSHQPFLYRMLGELETARGAYEQAERSIAEAGTLAVQLQEPQFLAPYHVAVATLAAERGDSRRVARSVAEALAASTGSAQEDVAVLACLQGLRSTADEAAELRLRRHSDLAAVVEAGERLWMRAQDLAQAVVTSGADLPDCAAALTQCRAEEARLRGTEDAALWSAAVRGWQERRKPYAVAYAQWRLAAVLLALRQVSAARAPLREALRTTEQLRAESLRQRVLELARRARLDVGAVPAPRTTGPDTGLTPRELEVLQCLAAGATNREISQALFISLKTVDNHVTHVMEKLQARNRVEAAATGQRLGLIAAWRPVDGPHGNPRRPGTLRSTSS